MSRRKLSAIAVLGALVSVFLTSAGRPISSVGFTGGFADTGGGGGTPISVMVSTSTPVSGIGWDSQGYFSTNSSADHAIRFEAAPTPLFSGAVYHWTFTCVNASNNMAWHWSTPDGNYFVTGWVDHPGKITAKCTVSYGTRSGSGSCDAYAIGGPITLTSSHNPPRDVKSIAPTTPSSMPLYLDYYNSSTAVTPKSTITGTIDFLADQPAGTTYKWHYTNLMIMYPGALDTNNTCKFWARDKSVTRGDGMISLTYTLNGVSYDDCDIDRRVTGVADTGYRLVTCHMPAMVRQWSNETLDTINDTFRMGAIFEMELMDNIGDPMPNVAVIPRFVNGPPATSALGYPVTVVVNEAMTTGAYGPADAGYTANGRFRTAVQTTPISDGDYVAWDHQYFAGTTSQDPADGGTPLSKYRCKVDPAFTLHSMGGAGAVGPDQWLLFLLKYRL